VYLIKEMENLGYTVLACLLG